MSRVKPLQLSLIMVATAGLCVCLQQDRLAACLRTLEQHDIDRETRAAQSIEQTWNQETTQQTAVLIQAAAHGAVADVLGQGHNRALSDSSVTAIRHLGRGDYSVLGVLQLSGARDRLQVADPDDVYGYLNGAYNQEDGVFEFVCGLRQDGRKFRLVYLCINPPGAARETLVSPGSYFCKDYPNPPTAHPRVSSEDNDD